MDEKTVPQAEDGAVMEVPESSRREFIGKLVAVAGAVAASGVLAQGAAEAASDDKLVDVEGKFIKIDSAVSDRDAVTIKWGKVRSGFRVSLSGRQLGTVLKDMGVLAAGANLDNAAITIEFTA